ncbi:MAG: DUF563 domain-containing protein [Rhodothermales bacterium]
MSISSVINKLIPHARYNVKKQGPNRVLQLGDDPALYSPELNGPTQMGDLPIYIYDDVLLWPGQSIASRGGCLIQQTFIDNDRINTVRKARVLRRYPVMRFDGWATSIDYIFSPHNYYHQFVDSLPRAWALRHPELARLPITVFMTREMSNDQKRILQAILPENVKVRVVPRYIRIKATHYIHLPFLSKNRTGYNPKDTLTSAGFIPNKYIEAYRNIVFEMKKNHLDSEHMHMYVSRHKATQRRITNEDEVIDHLKQKGFRVVVLEDMSLSEQAQCFATSDIIVAQHGAALTNLLYKKYGGLIEIFSSKQSPHHYSEHARTLGLHYEAINLENSNYSDDVDVPVALLDAAVKRAMNKMNDRLAQAG